MEFVPFPFHTAPWTPNNILSHFLTSQKQTHKQKIKQK